ncbi:M48 family metallopeptidase [Paraflavitalea speifideaquila]|uniref:M48 family metallopeptidase n=1 Tax=Paraflavitalea speifideaquila TaxID=3076558 RepID=UPI0028EEFAFC|nr:M48 family metallopeptidase [Paraflavitalea speifideiaquila]
MSSLRIAAQTIVFTPATEDIDLLKKLSLQYEEKYKLTITSLPAQNKEDLQKLYQQRWENIKSKFNDKEIYTDPTARGYLEALVNELIQGNPQLKQRDFQCFFSRSGIPNASYIGEGIILFNMGLFHRLENESQVAFVLAHEIAHFFLNHSDNAINRYVSALNSEEVQAALRKIKGSEFGKREQVDKLVKGLTFNSRRHSRDHESQADSMAVMFLRNTKFDITSAVTTLALLDTIDTDNFNTATALENTFNSPKYPFQKKWIRKEEGLLGGHALLNEDALPDDSLKTHPDCRQRIQYLQPMINSASQTITASNPINKTTFETLAQTFRQEIIAYTYTANNYSRSLYYTLRQLQKTPTDPYLITHTGTLLNRIYEAQKSHTLGKYIDLPGPAYPGNYNLLLQFIQNLYLENIASISYHFLNRHHAQLSQHEPFKVAYSASIQIAQQ